ncbi:MAG: hypothetical protein ACK476_05060, partial [Fluviicola sp.]
EKVLFDDTLSKTFWLEKSKSSSVTKLGVSLFSVKCRVIYKKTEYRPRPFWHHLFVAMTKRWYE